MPPTSGFDRALVSSLRSTVEQDLVTNLYLLRRGVDWNGNPVSVTSFDRQRTVASYDPEQGAVNVDRPWQFVPLGGELLEFHHLDPEQELRPSVLAGLRRCFFEDRFSLGSGFIYEVDLTASLPWLRRASQISRVQVAPFPSGFYGYPCDIPFSTFGQGGHVCIRLNTGWGGPYYGGVLVSAIRSHFTWVNGVDSTTGPQSDADTLEVDLGYAVAAAHIEAWHNFPAKLQAAAAGGLQATQGMAALEFTRQARTWAPEQVDLWQMEQLLGGRGQPVVVNA